MSVHEMIREAKTLPPDEIKLLVQALMALIPESKEPASHSIVELRGLGKELWAGIDAQDYVNQLRSEWD